MIDSGSDSDGTVFVGKYDCPTLFSQNSVKNVTWMENTWNQWMENSHIADPEILCFEWDYFYSNSSRYSYFLYGVGSNFGRMLIAL